MVRYYFVCDDKNSPLKWSTSPELENVLLKMNAVYEYYNESMTYIYHMSKDTDQRQTFIQPRYDNYTSTSLRRVCAWALAASSYTERIRFISPRPVLKLRAWGLRVCLKFWVKSTRLLILYAMWVLSSRLFKNFVTFRMSIELNVTTNYWKSK